MLGPRPIVPDNRSVRFDMISSPHVRQSLFPEVEGILAILHLAALLIGVVHQVEKVLRLTAYPEATGVRLQGYPASENYIIKY